MFTWNHGLGFKLLAFFHSSLNTSSIKAARYDKSGDPNSDSYRRTGSSIRCTTGLKCIKCVQSIDIWIYVTIYRERERERENLRPRFARPCFISEPWEYDPALCLSSNLRIPDGSQHATCLSCARDGPWNTCISKGGSRHTNVILFLISVSFWMPAGYRFTPWWVQLCDLARSLMVQSSQIHWQGPTSKKKRPLEELWHAFGSMNSGPNAKWTV